MITSFRYALTLGLVLSLALLCGCVPSKIKLFSDASDPLRESVLEGTADEKVVVISIRGFIDTDPESDMIRKRPGMVQEIVSQLDKAAADDSVRALVLVVDSPGGSVTASDILYREIADFKSRTGATVVASFLGLAASGGYYASLPADVIMAHPTTITGSVGTIFLMPNVSGLLDKIGVEVLVAKSGRYKDIGSPFKDTEQGERRIIQDIVDDLNDRFLTLVVKHRSIPQEYIGPVSEARVFTAREALRIGLVDKIGFVDDAIAEARKLAGLPEDARVIAYRRSVYAEDNPYNPFTTETTDFSRLVDLGLSDYLPRNEPGFYHLWSPQH